LLLIELIRADSNDSTRGDTQGADNAGRAWYAAYRAGRATDRDL